MAKNGNGFDEWGGYMDAKITKLEEQFASASDPFRQTNLFAGISIFVNGLTNPSSDELKRIMMVHGGTYHIYERSHTTYIIASNLPDVKVRNMDTSKIISPQWVVDCVSSKKILDYTKYLLYTNQRKSQPRICFTAQKKTEEEAEHKLLSAADKEEQDVANILKDLEEINEKMNPPDVKNKLETSTASTTKSSGMARTAVDPNEKMNPPDVKNKLETSTASTTKSSGMARTAVDPKFLSEFYNNSRLHHIATLGAGFKQYVSELRAEHSGNFPIRQTLRESLPKVANFVKKEQTVMHIDMDCFFVSVGLRSHPHLRGQPIAVTHSKGGSGEVAIHPGVDRKKEMDMFLEKIDTQLHNNILSDKVRGAFEGKLSLSEIASCSYEAREKRVRNGMFVGQALKLCPNLKTIPYDFEGYKEVAYTLYNTIAQYTLDIEAVSCDEMFVNLAELVNELQIDPMDFVTFVRNEVREKTSCPCSAGVGGNKLQARMATKKAKPDGQFILCSDNVEEYMSTIPIKDLPGVGSSTMYTLGEMNLLTCEDLRKVPLSKLQTTIGKKFGETLHQFCRGIDPRPLVYGQVRKSVSAEVNYGIRFKENTELETFLRQLCTEVHTRLIDIRRKGKCITLKVMVRAKDAPVETSKFMGHGVCDYITKAVSLSDYTCDQETITRTVLTTMKALNISPNELRGIGIQITKLDEPNEPKEKKENVIKNMFDKAAEKRKENPKVENKTTSIHDNSKLPSPPKASKVKPKGRPNKKTTKIPNVMGMLQNAALTKRTATSESDLPDDIDPTVLAELPEDIRREILQSHARRTIKTAKVEPAQIKSQPPRITKIDEEFLSAMPSELKKEVQMQIGNINAENKKLQPQTVEISLDNIFQQSERMKLLLDWVKSSSTPENYDVELISEHAKEFIRAKKIHDLYDPLVYLCRIINRFGNCGWHTAYHVIIGAVQNQMCSTYGSKLFLGDKIECTKCSM